MPKRKYYAVFSGRVPGIYNTWSDCKKQVIGFKHAKYRGFTKRDDAEAYLKEGDTSATISSVIASAKKRGITVVYTDGSCISGKAGIGVFFGDGDSRNLSEPLPVGQRQTNQRAEVVAVIRALETVQDSTPVHIYTDSRYVIGAATDWMQHWKTSGWKCTNADLFKRLDGLLSTREEGSIKWVHVFGHSGNYGNDMADRLAKSAVLQSD